MSRPGPPYNLLRPPPDPDLSFHHFIGAPWIAPKNEQLQMKTRKKEYTFMGSDFSAVLEQNAANGRPKT